MHGGSNYPAGMMHGAYQVLNKTSSDITIVYGYVSIERVCYLY